MAPEPPPGRQQNSGRLLWVELGRGFAALAVVLYHASRLMQEPQYSGRPFAEKLFGLGFLGVDFFFVLSGFIILHVHYSDIGRPDRALRYGWRRVARIFPTYWFVLGFALLVNLLLQSNKAPLAPGWLLNEMLLAPGRDLWLNPAWTLRHELIFYALFSAMLFVGRLGILVHLIWFGLILVLGVELWETGRPADSNSLTAIFLHPYNLNFFFGMAMAFAFRHRQWLPRLIGLFAMAGLMFLAHVAMTGIDWYSIWRFIGVGALCAALLGMLLLLSTKAAPPPPVASLLGAISYSLYLSHIILMPLLLAVLARLGIYRKVPEPLIFLGQVGIALICAWSIYRLVEKPVLRWAHGKFNN